MIKTPGADRGQMLNEFFDGSPAGLRRLALRAAELDTAGTQAIYVTLNPLKPETLTTQSGPGARAGDVVSRRWLLIDCDPTRPDAFKKASASDAEKNAAKDAAYRIKAHLTSLGWPAPVVADSGNGYHLLYRVDLPVDDGGLVKRILRALAGAFNSAAVKVDIVPHDPPRICKLYGTTSRKGDDTADRPWRESALVGVPERIDPVPAALLEQLASQAPTATAPQSKKTGKAAPKPVASTHTRPSLELAEWQNRIQRGQRYLEEMPPSVSGQNGHTTLLRAAVALVRGLELPLAYALPLLKEYNTRAKPPWPEAELIRKLNQAKTKSHRDWGYLLADKEAAYGVGADITDPRHMAAKFLDEATMIAYKSSFWDYDGRKYREASKDEMRGRLFNHCQSVVDEEYAANLKRWRKECDRVDQQNQGRRAGERQIPRPRFGHKPRVTTEMVNTVMGHIGGMAQVPDSLPMPSWLPDSSQPNLIAFENGLLDIDALLRGEPDVLRPHSPDWFSTISLPYAYDPTATCPVFQKTLAAAVEGDQERINLLQEWFGYHLQRTTDAQKFMVLTGEGGTGKSTILAALEATVGEVNVSSVCLEGFGERFGLTPTLGKAANICSDLNEMDRVAEGRLKQYTDGSKMTFDRKGLSPIEDRPTARLTLATNNPPRVSDKSDAVYRRQLLVPLNRRVPAAERVIGMDKPTFWRSEAPGILNWAIEGLKRLKANGYQFTAPTACQVAAERHRLDSDPTRAFLLEYLEPDPQARPLPTERLYGAYAKHMDRNGHNRPLASNAFARSVESVFPDATRERVSFPGGGRFMSWRGLREKEHLPVADHWPV
jgi:P4 family phage/plasmid primase-like protien